jgi:hypothetical protein
LRTVLIFAESITVIFTIEGNDLLLKEIIFIVKFIAFFGDQLVLILIT